MRALEPDLFLQNLAEQREAFWSKMTAEGKSYGAEKPLTQETVVRRLQFGVVMERRAAEVSARWIPTVPDLDLQHVLSEYVANELKHATILRGRIVELDGDPDALWKTPLRELRELWNYHASLGSFCELVASVQYGHEEFFPRTSRSFIQRVEPIDPKTAAIYRDTLLVEEEAHEWLAPEALRRYALDGDIQGRCLEALQKGCELFSRAIRSFNQTTS
ncbi:MAG: hypothetical protein ACREP8_07985 [Candidatus Binatia bacterium]